MQTSKGLIPSKKRKSGKKRILRRVYFEANSKQSSYSDVVTSYIDASNPQSLEMLSDIEEVNEEQQNEQKDSPSRKSILKAGYFYLQNRVFLNTAMNVLKQKSLTINNK